MKRSFASTHHHDSSSCGGIAGTPRQQLPKQARRRSGGGGGSGRVTKQLSLHAFLTVPTPQTKVSVCVYVC